MKPQTISAERSSIMRSVKSKNTAPELEVRHFVYKAGFRYRLHRRDLPGVPDLVFVGMRKVIFVHGCFWHGHGCPRGSRVPKTRRPYWQDKICRNTSRDLQHLSHLKNLGWSVLVIWECELRENKTSIERSIMRFLRKK